MVGGKRFIGQYTLVSFQLDDLSSECVYIKKKNYFQSTVAIEDHSSGVLEKTI
jgi:hypothetical protein